MALVPKRVLTEKIRDLVKKQFQRMRTEKPKDQQLEDLLNE